MTRDELIKALDGLHAYDDGAVDSGIRDESLRARCIEELKRITAAEPEDGREFFSRLVRDMWLSEEAIEQGYGIEDALGFVDWLDERMGIYLR